MGLFSIKAAADFRELIRDEKDKVLCYVSFLTPPLNCFVII